MNDANPRQQIVDSIKNNNNVLVTVSTNPSVDELSAALGLTILLNNIGKRGTAVVSGAIPPAIDFLEPGKTFEHTTDSLRDFIIALDKEKADHLRYKVEGDVVKIFITPYRTLLSEKDLQFSLGDYNVEVVIALGVKDQDHLDKALDAHGAILHDATVITMTAGETVSNLGSINWQDQTASSLCEMLVSLSEALKDDKPLLDQQTATALLTGIVSATDRFSNDHTTSRVMTMAAQLMAAGANQQLIAAKLQEAHEIGPNASPTGVKVQNSDGTTSLAEGAGPTKVRKQNGVEETQNPQDGLLIAIDHPEPAKKPKKEKAPAPKKEAKPAPAPEPAKAPSEETVEQQLARELAEVAPVASGVPAPSLGDELANAAQAQPPAEMPQPTLESPKLDFEALLPNAEPPAAPPPPPTGEYMSQPPAMPAMNAAAQPDPGVASVDPFAKPLVSPNLPPLQPPTDLFTAAPTHEPQVAHMITPPHAPDEIEYEESPIPNDPAAVAAVPDFAAMNPTGLSSAPAPLGEPAAVNPPAEPIVGGPSLDNLPPLPPLPDLSAPPPVDGANPGENGAPPPPPLPTNQFQIPGQ